MLRLKSVWKFDSSFLNVKIDGLSYPFNLCNKLKINNYMPSNLLDVSLNMRLSRGHYNLPNSKILFKIFFFVTGYYLKLFK